MNSNFWGYKDKLEESLRELNFKGDILFVRNEEGVFMIRYSDNRVLNVLYVGEDFGKDDPLVGKRVYTLDEIVN